MAHGRGGIRVYELVRGGATFMLGSNHPSYKSKLKKLGELCLGVLGTPIINLKAL